MLKLPLTNEFACSLLSHDIDDSEELKIDPKGYIFSRLNYEVSDTIDLSVAENGSDEVHLALPYYSTLDERSIQNIEDESMDSISGGRSFYPRSDWRRVNRVK